MSAAAVAVAVLAAGSVGPASGSGSGGDHDHGHTIRVLSTNTEENYVDSGATGPSLGDMYVFHSELTRYGKHVGHTGVVCTLTSAVNEESQCLGSAWFDRWGEITIQGLVAGEPQRFSFPITGGSGAFEGAEGTLRVKEVSDTVEKLSFHLTR
jgi:hypothetical protein